MDELIEPGAVFDATDFADAGSSQPDDHAEIDALLEEIDALQPDPHDEDPAKDEEDTEADLEWLVAQCEQSLSDEVEGENPWVD